MYSRSGVPECGHHHIVCPELSCESTAECTLQKHPPIHPPSRNKERKKERKKERRDKEIKRETKKQTNKHRKNRKIHRKKQRERETERTKNLDLVYGLWSVHHAACHLQREQMDGAACTHACVRARVLMNT